MTKTHSLHLAIAWLRASKLTPIVVLLLLGLALVAGPAPAHAMQPPADSPPADSAGMTCSNTERLASIVQAEAYSQQEMAHVAIAQIVAREAQGRGMTICELSERTGFVSVFHYALAHPNSWTARQFAQPENWSMRLAADVLAGRLPDATQGAGHFDGVAHTDDIFVIGETHFQP